MKRMLNTLGYYANTHYMTGERFDETTVIALMRFQLYHMKLDWSELFTAEGIYVGAGNNTSKALFEAYEFYNSLGKWYPNTFKQKFGYHVSKVTDDRIKNPANFITQRNGEYYDKTSFSNLQYYSENRFLTKEEMLVNAKIIAEFLLAAGWTKTAIAAVLGNMETESTINPGRWQIGYANNTKGGYGLVQWTPATKYMNWVDNNGLGSYSNIINQLKRIQYEVEENIQWQNSSMTFYEFTQSTAEEYDLAIMFLKYYEQPSARAVEQTKDTRGTQAEYWYSKLFG